MSRQPSFATVIIGKNGLLREGISQILCAANSRTLASVSSIEALSSGQLRKCPLLFLLVHPDEDADVTPERIDALRSQNPAARIAIVTDRHRPDKQISAFRAGVNGYFVNVTSCAVFVKCIELIMMGETIFPPTFISHALAHESEEHCSNAIRPRSEQPILFKTEKTVAPHLSPRERSILHCLIEGASNKSIARKMDIAEATVKVHVKAILRKIRVQNRTQAAIWGVNNGPLAGVSNIEALPSIADVVRPSSRQADKSVIKRSETSDPLEILGQRDGYVGVPNIGRLMRSAISRRTIGTT